MYLCAVHKAVLAEAGEVADGPPAVVSVVAVRPVGRPPTPVPQAALDAVRAGAPVKETARAHGVDRNTLKRRAEQPPEEDVVETTPLEEAARILAAAAKDRARGLAMVAKADEQIARVRALLEGL